MNKTILLIFLLTLLPLVSAQEEIEIYFFHGQGCPHCASMESFLSKIEDTITIKSFETYSNQKNRELFQRTAQAYNTEIQGVPTVFINDKVFVGYNSQIAEQIKDEIKFCQENHCQTPSSQIQDPSEFKKLTIPIVLAAAIVDAINPCAFAVLIILLTTILTSKNRKRALLAGIVFSIAIFISYFLMGLGLYSAIQFSGFTHNFYIIVAILAILIGLFNLKDYFWYGKWFIMEVPMKWRPKLKSLLKSITSVPGAFLIGFVISLFLLPCTSGPYIVILGLLANTVTKNYALFLLLIYNLVFILPMLLITLGVYLGFTSTEKAEEWRQKKLKVLHLIAGIILLLLGTGMLVALKFNWI